MIDVLPFPILTFSETNGLYDQLQHIKSEVRKLELAFENEPIERMAEKAADVAISTKTFLDIINRQHAIAPIDAVTRAQQKNRSRGYEL